MGPELVMHQGQVHRVEAGGKQRPPEPLRGSFCAFTLNGESLGVAFVDMLEVITLRC